uniref:Uncharacterized protein n=1 Tax=Klebsiella pneumoniae TaxID=573 RepID=A0A8B0SSS3_KLEPN|nr:hypothetical protein [Klebsiella pneumoniae]
MFTKRTRCLLACRSSKKSVATNAYALAGVPVNVDEAENAGGGVDEGLASKKCF